MVRGKHGCFPNLTFLLFAIALGGLENTGWVLLAGGAVVMAAAWVLRRMQGTTP